MFGSLIEDEHKLGFQSTNATAYDLIVPLCLKIQQKEKERQAFDYVERSKSRAFIDLMSVNVSIRPSVAITENLNMLVDRESHIIAKLRTIQTQYYRNERARIEPGEIDQLRNELNSIYDEISKYDKQYVSLRRPKSLSLEDIIAKIAAIGTNTLLVEYFVTEEKTFVFIVNKNELHVKEIEVTRGELRRYVDGYQRCHMLFT